MSHKISESSSTLHTLTGKLNDITDTYEELQDEYQRKSSDDVCNVNGRVIRLKDALQCIKGDIVRLDLSCGLVSNQLLQYKIGNANKRIYKAMMKRNKHKVSHLIEDIDDYGVEYPIFDE